MENEYGSRPWCDIVYTTFLRDLFRRYVGYDFVLVTVDGGGLGYLKCGYIPDVYPTVDFGAGSKAQIAKSFAAQRTYAPRGPLINSEFYPGWLDNWGSNFSQVATNPILNSMADMYEMGANFNFYMFMGNAAILLKNQYKLRTTHKISSCIAPIRKIVKMYQTRSK